MKPPWFAHFLARLPGLGIPLGTLTMWSLIAIPVFRAGALDLGSLGVKALVALFMIGLGLIGMMVPGTLFQALLGYLVKRLQGWPFAKGDRVWILSGPFQNRIRTVAEVWDQRGEVRVDLGFGVEAPARDVFADHQVRRVI